MIAAWQPHTFQTFLVFWSSLHVVHQSLHRLVAHLLVGTNNWFVWFATLCTVLHSPVLLVLLGLIYYMLVFILLCENSVFLNINPTSGTKITRVQGKKSRSGGHEKVLSLIREMSVHEVLAE